MPPIPAKPNIGGIEHAAFWASICRLLLISRATYAHSPAISGPALGIGPPPCERMSHQVIRTGSAICLGVQVCTLAWNFKGCTELSPSALLLRMHHKSHASLCQRARHKPLQSPETSSVLLQCCLCFYQGACKRCKDKQTIGDCQGNFTRVLPVR